MSDPSNNDLGVLIEQVIHQNQVILENLTDMQVKVNKIPIIEGKLDNLQADMNTVKSALKATNVQVQDHEDRITVLEQVA